jgi:hypothetical protein
LRSYDFLKIYYCPAVYSEPTRRFPQIKMIGPVSDIFSGFNSDPSKPTGLILGMGFEPGVSMGILSQLEPKIALCFWGSGIDSRFDNAVSRANLNFDFADYKTKLVDYIVEDPIGTAFYLESLIYGLVSTYNVILIPMGPKIFAFLSALVSMSYLGDVAVWRVEQSFADAGDSKPGRTVIRALVDTDFLKRYSQRERELLGMG